MKTVTNKTQKPSPFPCREVRPCISASEKTAAITTNASEHPPLKKLVDAGQIEIHDEVLLPRRERGGKAGLTWMPGHGSRAGHRGGDR